MLTSLHKQDALLKYLGSAMQGLNTSDGLQIQQFKHGQSNPTYLLQVSLAHKLQHALKPSSNAAVGPRVSAYHVSCRTGTVSMCCARSLLGKY